jgi:sulfate/thiosulfate transport system substrate-binding protein
MLRTVVAVLIGLYLLGATCWVILSGVVRTSDEVELLNVACDPTRELWRDVNAKFVSQYRTPEGKPIVVRQSHGGSASQARSVIDGLDADVVTLALPSDVDAIAQRGLIYEGWQDKFPNHSLPFTSTIVFVVRKGNPKGIRDWGDLIQPGVGIITPNPKTSGNGKWSFLAMWGSIIAQGGSDAEARQFVKMAFQHAPILDASARGATLTFSKKGIGDVHLTWENEAYLEVREAEGQLEIVYPSRSVLAEPPVAIVDRVVERKGTRAAAEAYLHFLYTEPAQEIIASHYYRPILESVQQKHAEQFPPIELFRVIPTLGADWDAVHARFFAEGAIFDQVFAEPRNP